MDFCEHCKLLPPQLNGIFIVLPRTQYTRWLVGRVFINLYQNAQHLCAVGAATK